MKTVFLIVLLYILCCLLFSQPIWAYSSASSAYLVIGQGIFTSSGASSTWQGLNGPAGLASDGTHLLVADSSNNRIMLYNTIPQSNNPYPDIVIGQQNVTSNGVNQGGAVAGNTLNNPTQLDITSGKLLVTDTGNNRILIFLTLPQKNNIPADFVIGQADATSSVSAVSATQLASPRSVAYDPGSGKVAIADTGNNRVLVYNKIPLTNNQAADLVLGQTNFATNSAGIRQDALSSPYSVKFVNGKLIVADTGNNRVLIWNTIPAATGQPADIVIGQANFTSNSANQGQSTGANTLSSPVDTSFDGTRFIITDQGNNRLLIFNTLPSNNNPNADQVLGQSNFNNNTANTSGNSLSSPGGGVASAGRLLMACDTGNNRVLFFYNFYSTTTMTLTNTPQSSPNAPLRMYGNITLTNYYTVKGVQFQVNSGIWQGAIAVSGNFGQANQDFYVDYDPASNKKGDGYTLHLNTTNSNNDLSDNLFYFEPFHINGPENGFVTNEYYPTFEFTVNKQLQTMSDNLSNYQIWTKRPGTTNWNVYISGIPIDFNLNRLDAANIKAGDYPAVTHNGVYDTSAWTAVYSNDSSTIRVHGKNGYWLTGTYQWKIVAVDKAGHTQETEQRTFTSNTFSPIYNNQIFPLEILSISGAGSLILNTFSPWKIKSLYTTFVLNPAIYGIAPKNALVTLNITDVLCKQNKHQNCVQTVTTTANSDSRFGINIPQQTLKQNQIYALSLSEVLENNYNELPIINLRINIPQNATFHPHVKYSPVTHSVRIFK